MKRGVDWYPRDPIRFLDGVQGMGPDLIGAYAVLIDLLYARGGSTHRDDRHLSGLLGCSIRKAAALTDALIERGKIRLDAAGDLHNPTVDKTVLVRRDIAEKRSEAGRKGGQASAAKRAGGGGNAPENEPKPSRNGAETNAKRVRSECENATASSEINTLAEPLLNHIREREERDIREERSAAATVALPSPRESQTDPPKAAAGTAESLWRDVIHAAGVDRGRLPTHWMPPAAEIHVWRWTADLGLSADEVIATVRACRERHADPPGGPKAFDRAMRATAAAKTAPALTPAAGAADGTARPQTAADRRHDARVAGTRAIARAATALAASDLGCG